MISARSLTGANTADRVPATTRASPRRMRCHCSARSASDIPGMQDGDFVAEHLMQIGRHRRGQSNLRNQQDRRAPCFKHLPHAGQIHRRLSRARDAVQQHTRKLARCHAFANLLERLFLRRAELELKRRLAAA